MAKREEREAAWADPGLHRQAVGGKALETRRGAGSSAESLVDRQGTKWLKTALASPTRSSISSSNSIQCIGSCIANDAVAVVAAVGVNVGISILIDAEAETESKPL